eukprot:TRINITY_DN7945_c0_g2_i1.p1 TRINITY_DN7945_c0_g2~~TRINITY_DN7945_c0_g2_i1.p1  ORF type:complete len:104 (+),score=9.38 TRINITY_DN7945_c0_g2_i1:212-523(+)
MCPQTSIAWTSVPVAIGPWWNAVASHTTRATGTSAYILSRSRPASLSTCMGAIDFGVVVFFVESTYFSSPIHIFKSCFSKHLCFSHEGKTKVKTKVRSELPSL